MPKIAIYATPKMPPEKITPLSREGEGARAESALVNLKICISNSVESKSQNQFIAEHQAHLPNASSQECLFHVTSKRNRMKSSKNRDVVDFGVEGESRLKVIIKSRRVLSSRTE